MKITGIMRKVEPLPMPEVTNSTMNMTKKPVEVAAAAALRQEVQHAEHAGDHHDEVPQA